MWVKRPFRRPSGIQLVTGMILSTPKVEPTTHNSAKQHSDITMSNHMNMNAVNGGGGGNIHNSNMNSNVQILNLSNASQIQLQKHQQVALEFEVKKVMATIDVPTLPQQVRVALRNIGVPIRFFGENLADIRNRLRYELAKRQVLNAGGVQQQHGAETAEGAEAGDEEEEVTKYTHASNELIVARQAITKFSLQRAQIRLQDERAFRNAYKNIKKRQRNEDIQLEHTVIEEELEKINDKCIKTYKSLRQMMLEGSQYGDSRVLSCICSTQNNTLLDGSRIIATGSWTGNVQLWDGGSSDGSKNTSLTKIGEQLSCHEDRIMGMAMMTTTATTATSAILCTTSIDRTAKLWKVQRNDDHPTLNEMEESNPNVWSMTEQSHLKGHTKRLCRTAFHPMKKHVATTSFDYSWRLWDVETSQNTMQLLLQDGHWKETYGIGFHPDGSLCATTDFAGVIQLWDLRTGKSIRHFLGHAKRILNAEFHPTNGYQLVSSGDDGTIKVWDIRQRKQLSSIPAHSKLITQLRFDPDPCSEYLASSSFDGTIKFWSTRTWTLLNTLKGHDGKVSGIDILSSSNGNHCTRSIVSCGFDKTLKIWK